jgi:hypothetical protein
MPVPEWGRHTGHLVQAGACQECGTYLKHDDNTAPPCPVCRVMPGAECRGKSGAHVHIERMWLSHGHAEAEFPALRERIAANRRPAGRNQP